MPPFTHQTSKQFNLLGADLAKCCCNPELSTDFKILLKGLILYLKGLFKLFNNPREQYLSSCKNHLALNCARVCCDSFFLPPFLIKGKEETNNMNWEIPNCNAD